MSQVRLLSVSFPVISKIFFFKWMHFNNVCVSQEKHGLQLRNVVVVIIVRNIEIQQQLLRSTFLQAWIEENIFGDYKRIYYIKESTLIKIFFLILQFIQKNGFIVLISLSQWINQPREKIVDFVA